MIGDVTTVDLMCFATALPFNVQRLDLRVLSI